MSKKKPKTVRLDPSVLQLSQEAVAAATRSLEEQINRTGKPWTGTFRLRAEKVAIVGFAESKHQAPWTDPAFEFWTMNMVQKDLEHVAWTRWFELHQRKYLEAHPLWRSNFHWHVSTFRSWKHTPLYVWNPAEWPDCPTVKAYPKTAIERAFPRGAYHQGSFDWMLALAIHEGFKEIHVYGWDNQRGGEPISSRACLEYWIGIAEGRGIKVYTPDVGDLFATYQLVRSHKQYGYDDAQLIEGIYDPIPGHE